MIIKGESLKGVREDERREGKGLRRRKGRGRGVWWLMAGTCKKR